VFSSRVCHSQLNVIAINRQTLFTQALTAVAYG
jgi:hypothetical protein